MADLPDPGVIEGLLEALANRADGAIVAQLPREAGRRDSRWAQLFEELPEIVAAGANDPVEDSAPASRPAARVHPASWPRASPRSKVKWPRCAPSSRP